jgi:hypothetical protein
MFLNIRGSYTMRVRAQQEDSGRWSEWVNVTFERAQLPTATPTATNTPGPSPTASPTPTVTPTVQPCDPAQTTLLGNGWSAGDIGNPNEEGSTIQEGPDSFYVCGGGWNIWDDNDEFRYVYQQAPAGFQEIEAEVTFFDGSVNGWTKAGLMIRDSLSSDAKNYMVRLTRDHGTTAQWRDSTGGTTDNYDNEREVPIPVRMRITKDGDQIRGWVWQFGEWKPMEDDTISFSEPFYIGFAITSHNDNSGKFASARFNIISIK